MRFCKRKGGARTASVHLNSPTNNRVSDVVIRKVLLKSDFRNAAAAAFESSIVVNGVFEVEVHLFVPAGGWDSGDNDKSSVVSRAYAFRETSFGDDFG
jgi:hypothetical protein